MMLRLVALAVTFADSAVVAATTATGSASPSTRELVEDLLSTNVDISRLHLCDERIANTVALEIDKNRGLIKLSSIPGFENGSGADVPLQDALEKHILPLVDSLADHFGKEFVPCLSRLVKFTIENVEKSRETPMEGIADTKEADELITELRSRLKLYNRHVLRARRTILAAGQIRNAVYSRELEGRRRELDYRNYQQLGGALENECSATAGARTRMVADIGSKLGGEIIGLKMDRGGEIHGSDSTDSGIDSVHSTINWIIQDLVNRVEEGRKARERDEDAPLFEIDGEELHRVVDEVANPDFRVPGHGPSNFSVPHIPISGTPNPSPFPGFSVTSGGGDGPSSPPSDTQTGTQRRSDKDVILYSMVKIVISLAVMAASIIAIIFIAK